MFDLHSTHEQAMNLAEEAFREKEQGSEDGAIVLFARAMELELRCAQSFPANLESEPSRSILYRSAASLAFNAKQYEVAENLTYQGLAGSPPQEIREELKILLDDVRFEQSLHNSGIKLSPSDFEMTIRGHSIGISGAPLDVLMLRFDMVQKLVHRTAERLLGQSYRNAGGATRQVRQKFPIYVTDTRPGSFIVTMQVGAFYQEPLFDLTTLESTRPIVESDQVVSELIECMKLYEKNEQPSLKERINDPAYYTNFVGLVKQISPDGERVSSVGFRYQSHSAIEVVSFKQSGRPPKSVVDDSSTYAITVPSLPEGALATIDGEPDTILLTGYLRRADTPRTAGSHTYGSIILVDISTGDDVPIRVPLALMKDVVQPYYEETVTISARIRRGRTSSVHYVLEDISYANR